MKEINSFRKSNFNYYEDNNDNNKLQLELSEDISTVHLKNNFNNNNVFFFNFNYLNFFLIFFIFYLYFIR